MGRPSSSRVLFAHEGALQTYVESLRLFHERWLELRSVIVQLRPVHGHLAAFPSHLSHTEVRRWRHTLPLLSTPFFSLPVVLRRSRDHEIFLPAAPSSKGQGSRGLKCTGLVHVRVSAAAGSEAARTLRMLSKHTCTCIISAAFHLQITNQRISKETVQLGLPFLQPSSVPPGEKCLIHDDATGGGSTLLLS